MLAKIPSAGKLKEEENIDRTVSIKTRSSKLDERLDKIVKGLEKERAIDEETKSQYPFTQLLSSDDRKKFADLSESDKQKVSTKVAKVPTTEAGTIKKLWENALITNIAEPAWLELAPKQYREIYDEADDAIKESIQARAEYMLLENEYQIENFWQLSGLKSAPTVTLNENVVAPVKKDDKLSESYDPFMEMIKNKTKSYNQ